MSQKQFLSLSLLEGKNGFTSCGILVFTIQLVCTFLHAKTIFVTGHYMHCMRPLLYDKTHTIFVLFTNFSKTIQHPERNICKWEAFYLSHKNTSKCWCLVDFQGGGELGYQIPFRALNAVVSLHLTPTSLNEESTLIHKLGHVYNLLLHFFRCSCGHCFQQPLAVNSAYAARKQRKREQK